MRTFSHKKSRFLFGIKFIVNPSGFNFNLNFHWNFSYTCKFVQFHSKYYFTFSTVKIWLLLFIVPSCKCPESYRFIDVLLLFGVWFTEALLWFAFWSWFSPVSGEFILFGLFHGWTSADPQITKMIILTIDTPNVIQKTSLHCSSVDCRRKKAQFLKLCKWHFFKGIIKF